MGFSVILGNQLALLVSLFACLFGFLEPEGEKENEWNVRSCFSIIIKHGDSWMFSYDIRYFSRKEKKKMANLTLFGLVSGGIILTILILVRIMERIKIKWIKERIVLYVKEN